jgi:hypothetical protein
MLIWLLIDMLNKINTFWAYYRAVNLLQCYKAQNQTNPIKKSDRNSYERAIIQDHLSQRYNTSESWTNWWYKL